MRTLLRSLADSLEGCACSMTADLCDALRSSDGPTRLKASEPGPVSSALDQLLIAGSPDCHPLLTEIQRVRGALAWYRARRERVPEAVGARLFFVELLGPDGMLFCDRCRVGLLLMMPESSYPEHAHAAEELYLVLSGTAQWQGGNGKRSALPPGSFIHHPSGQHHAMRTGGEALLAVWGWTGDIGFESYSIEAGP